MIALHNHKTAKEELGYFQGPVAPYGANVVFLIISPCSTMIIPPDKLLNTLSRSTNYSVFMDGKKERKEKKKSIIQTCVPERTRNIPL